MFNTHPCPIQQHSRNPGARLKNSQKVNVTKTSRVYAPATEKLCSMKIPPSISIRPQVPGTNQNANHTDQSDLQVTLLPLTQQTHTAGSALCLSPTTHSPTHTHTPVSLLDTKMDVCCAAGAPVSIDYTPVGREEVLEGVPVYITGDAASAKAAVVGIYDIFGFTPQVRGWWVCV